MKHLLKTVKSMVCKSSLFVNSFFYPAEYVLQFVILDKVLTWLTSSTAKPFRHTTTIASKQLHHPIFQCVLPWKADCVVESKWICMYVVSFLLQKSQCTPHILLLIFLDVLGTRRHQHRWSNCAQV